MNMKKVRCISERKSMPGQIKVGHEYWADVDSTMKDEDGDRYYQIYLDKDAMYSVGNLLTLHFEEIFETVEGSYHMPAGNIFLEPSLRIIMNWFLIIFPMSLQKLQKKQQRKC